MIHELQTIRGLNGKPEFILLPIYVYKILQKKIEGILESDDNDYEPFLPEDYLSNPVTIARLKSGIKQKELAKRLNVSQAYVCKIEKEGYTISEALMERVKDVLKD